MCEHSGKLIAYLDRELPAAQAAEIEQHLGGCAECPIELATYQRTSGAFNAYCDAVVTQRARPRILRWVLPASGAAAAAIAAAVLLVVWHPRGQLPAVPAPLPVTVAAVEPPAQHQQVAPSPAAAVHKIRRQPFPAPAPAAAQTPNAHDNATAWLPADPVVQIAIPAEAMFAPGAVPEGISFNADLTIGPDGSVQRILVRP